MVILQDIPLKLEFQKIKGRLHAVGEKGLVKAQALLEIAKPLISARALYKVCFIEERPRDALVIDGTHFSSRVLQQNCEGVERVFPFVVTIGSDLENEAEAGKDLMDKYYLDRIGNIALLTARKYLEDHLRTKYALGGMSHMNPGSLKDWPIQEQRPLFSLLGDPEKAIGVQLNDSLLMIPRKSVSGIFFPTEVRFESCRLCPRERCDGRRATYSETLARKYGILKQD
ncbi:MAG: vitamin B12 dependent methionine synthase [Deltaproteobacteria bacterium]|nr:vitamin B12 dependent methionine synthase [Deltaproteobacteria bacterium]